MSPACKGDPPPSSPKTASSEAGHTTPGTTAAATTTSEAGSGTDAETQPPSDSYSNILPEDYVGPEVCGSCHKKNYALWKKHPHSTMNANASADTVVGDFSGLRLEYGDGSVEFDQEDGHYRMTLFKQGKLHRRYNITRTIGSRIIQMYVGVQSFGPEPPEEAEVYTNEVKLPFAWWVLRKEWFPETYDELPRSPEYDEDGALTAPYDIYDRKGVGSLHWQANCIRCHNTYPYVQRLVHGRRTGFLRRDLTYTGKLPKPRKDSIGWDLLEVKDLVTVGISCESCHLGGREHTENDRPIRFLPSSPDLKFPKATADLFEFKNARASAYVVNGICRQCHSAVTPGPDYPDGGGIWSSGEAKDLAGGACQGAARCTHCHNPHKAGPVHGGGPDEPAQVGACIGCHQEYTMPAAVQAHSHHPTAAGVTCLDCHMPRIVHGLQDMVRTHRISKPTDRRMFISGGPNACNLCHLDRSVLWATYNIEKNWGVALNPNASWKEWYGGELTGPLGLRWLQFGQPITRLVAADAFARARPKLAKMALPSVLGILEDPRPPNRLLGQFSVERILGRRLPPSEYLSWAPPETRARQMAALRAKLKIAPTN